MTATDAHNERAIVALRGDVEMWRGIAERYIAAFVDSELRLMAAKRLLHERIVANGKLQRTIDELRDEIACRSGGTR